MTKACVALTLATAFAATDSEAAKWPEKPMRVIVPYPSGVATDIIARMLAHRLAEEPGQRFVVDNRVGATGTIGSAIAVNATPDGYTIAVGSASYSNRAMPADGAVEVWPSELLIR